MKPIIIGAGLAGLMAALELAPMPVILISAGKIGEAGSSQWAQGGIAAALGPDDTPQFHADDTIKAGAGLCDSAVAHQVTQDGPAIIASLAQRGVAFDRDAGGQWRLGLEAAHSRRRIVHAAGDGTGFAVIKALTAAARTTPSIELIENTVAIRLILDAHGRVAGVKLRRGQEYFTLAARQVIVATGGTGGLWRHTTNPLSSTGQGLALAARAGAVMGDMEFMQFHPTAIDAGQGDDAPMPLASEALRGEGAQLIDENNRRFTSELLPRDIVARAIWQHLAAGHHVFLDARESLIPDFAARFPAISALCRNVGIDPATMPIPVRPAAHYHMGGIVTDTRGRASIEGLWACGEAACTGLHGANRLASNSLLEAACFGKRVADDIAATATPPGANLQSADAGLDDLRPTPEHASAIRALMSRHVGMIRDRRGLEQAVAQLQTMAPDSDMALAGLMIAAAALRRDESRGAQSRADYPDLNPAWARRQFFTLADILPSTHLRTSGAR